MDANSARSFVAALFARGKPVLLRSLRVRLAAVVFLTTVVALTMASVGRAFVDAAEARSAALAHRSSLVELVAAGATAGLAAGAPRQIEAVLASLAPDTHARAAVVYDASGRIVATWARCMTVFHNDAQALGAGFDPGFRATVADLGITDLDDLRRRAGEVIAGLPRLKRVAAAIMDATPEIER